MLCKMMPTTINTHLQLFPKEWEALLGLASLTDAALRKEKEEKEPHVKTESTLILNGHLGRNWTKLL